MCNSKLNPNYAIGAVKLRQLIKDELNIILDDFDFIVTDNKNSLVYTLTHNNTKYDFEYFYNTKKTEVSYYANSTDLFI